MEKGVLAENGREGEGANADLLRELEAIRQESEQLKLANKHLAQQVKRLTSEKVRSDLEVAETSFPSMGWIPGIGVDDMQFERLRAEGDLATLSLRERETEESVKRNLDEQMETLSKRAASLVSGLIPVFGSSSQPGLETDRQRSHLQLSSNNTEMRKEVEEIIMNFMSGSMEEEVAVESLSKLQYDVKLLPSGAASQDGPSFTEDRAEANGAPSNDTSQPSTSIGPQFGHTGSTPAGASLAGHIQFVLADPEKLQRLIARASTARTKSISSSKDAPSHGNTLQDLRSPQFIEPDCADHSAHAGGSSWLGGVNRWGSKFLSLSGTLGTNGSHREGHVEGVGGQPEADSTAMQANSSSGASKGPPSIVSTAPKPHGKSRSSRPSNESSRGGLGGLSSLGGSVASNIRGPSDVENAMPASIDLLKLRDDEGFAGDSDPFAARGMQLAKR